VWMRKLLELIRTSINFYYYRSSAGSPVGVVTPTYVGEDILDTVNSDWYKSTGLTTADWKVLT